MAENKDDIPEAAEQEADESAQIVDAELHHHHHHHGGGGHSGVTIVHETSSPSTGSHALTGSSGVGDPGGGGGVPVGVFVDGGTGAVLGPATFNPDTGVVEQPGTETTVVEETSTPVDASGTSSAGAGSAGAVEEVAPSAAGEDSEAIPDVGLVFPVNPADFQFRNGPGANEQHSRCVEFGIRFRVGGKPVTSPVRIFVKIIAPRRLGTGETISNEQAGKLAALGVQAAAEVVVELLELGLIVTSEAQTKFRKELNDVFRLARKGFQAQQCFVS